ncbi:MAG: sulfotransferase family protein [Balneola sp.]
MIKQDKTTRICLWSGPRNISTALMYSFAQRSDTKVFDEPLYGFYLSNTNASQYHPGAEEIISSMECNGSKVVEMMINTQEQPVVFFKNMTHHLLDLDRSFMKDMVNVILTRNPEEMLPSFDKVIENPSMKDVGYQDHLELLDFFENENIEPIVLDATIFLKNPERILKKLCSEISIPFEKNMLRWEKGARAEDGVWAPYWYGNIHNSTGFKKYQPKTDPFPENLTSLLKQSEPIYQNLRDKALQ